MAQPTDPARPDHHHAYLPIGDCIKRHRESLGLSQQELATRSKVNVDLIRKLEQLQREDTSVRTLRHLGRALDVSPGALLSTPRQLAVSDAGQDPVGAVAIRHALTAIPGLADVDLEQDGPLSVTDGQRALTMGWGAYWQGDYHVLGRLLPGAITRARAALDAVPSAERAAAAEVAAEVLRLAAATLVHLDYTDAAHLALQEALRHADDGNDRMEQEAVWASIVWTLLVEGRYADSQRLAVDRAERLQPVGDAPVGQQAMFGTFLLCAATAAGRDGDRATALHLVSEAAQVAAATGNTEVKSASFGPDQVLMQTVDVHTVTEHHSDALTVAKRMPRDSSLPLAARARHLCDVALGYVCEGRDEDAVTVLDAVESMAPTWARFQEQPRLVLLELRRRGANRGRVAALAARMGVALSPTG